MASKNRKQIDKRCETCDNLIPIGEGDHICYECGPLPVMPISEYEPTELYMECGGKEWKEK